jgi:hypothetical protein
MAGENTDPAADAAPTAAAEASNFRRVIFIDFLPQDPVWVRY